MNYLKSLLAARSLPDVLETPDGRAATAAEWESRVRPYWRKQMLTHIYGQLPQVLTPTVTTEVNQIDFAGKANWETVRFTFEKEGKTHTVPAQMITPKGEGPHPFFILLNFRPEVPDRYWPTEELIDAGYGVFGVCYQDVTADDGDFQSGLAGLFATEGERRPDEAGKLTYWAYMASRMMDYLLTRQEADPKRIGVIGHSRLGKTAQLAAALDERFAFACVNGSGTAGAALARGRDAAAESIRAICTRFPYWFAPNYYKYMDAPEALPLDQHCVAALIAPRRLLVGAAVEDLWADTAGQFLTCVAASPVWELYGKRGLVTPDALPSVGDVLGEGGVCFHLRAGKHYLSRTDWLSYLKTLSSIAENGKKE